MTLVRFFTRSFREADTLDEGLFQKNDGTVWIRNPDGSEDQITGGGDQGAQNLSGVLSVGADAGDRVITGLLDPVSDQDAATKAYVDSFPVIGPTGPTGATGPRGETGNAGATGATGNTGETGAHGATGATGPAGAAGSTGERGERGLTGSEGATGDRGVQGVQGEQGVKGDTGDVGATGADGPQGSIGERGPKGDKGDTGATGATGSTGAAGIAGPQTAPAVPASTQNAVSPFNFACLVTVRGVVSAVHVNGQALPGLGSLFLVPANGTIGLTYVVAPAWDWYGLA